MGITPPMGIPGRTPGNVSTVFGVGGFIRKQVGQLIWFIPCGQSGIVRMGKAYSYR